MEEWRNIEEFDGLYQVSSHGNIQSMRTGMLKAQPIDKQSGRPYVALWKNNKCYIFKPHRLVLKAFIGPCPKGMEGCHNDGNPLNNHISNLRWDTPKNNHADKVKHGTTNRGEQCGTAKLTLEQVIAIRKDDRLQRVIAEEYETTQSRISRIKNGKQWQHC